MERESVQQLWINLQEIEEKLRLQQNEIERLILSNQQLEDKLRAKESDLNQMKMLFQTSQQTASEEKMQFETKVQSLIDRIDAITGEDGN